MKKNLLIFLSLLLGVILTIAIGVFLYIQFAPQKEPLTEEPVLLFTIGMHVEPFGVEISDLVPEEYQKESDSESSIGISYQNAEVFQKGLEDIERVLEILESHDGRMTIQVQSPFTTTALGKRATQHLLGDWESRGHEIGLHFHEYSHLGVYANRLSSAIWCAVMKEEIDVIEALGVDHVRYWSGGNLYPDLLAVATCAGLEVNSDWKNPLLQETNLTMFGLSPWRPSGGSEGNDTSVFEVHDPEGDIIYLPEGDYDRKDAAASRRSEVAGGDEAYFDFLKDSLENSLANLEEDRVNVFHFTVHAGEFKDDETGDFDVIEQFLTEVIDPYVAEGKIEWATYSEMADAFEEWEETHPGVDPRSSVE
ncbi:MAG: hypothetical protein WC730_01665 [Patescibacteria group bacterium]|jgi:hypothetical protein